ncbi:MAG: sensor histidine kinase [Bacteroidota bacterium]|jgi:two-component system LytT family sensor kinase
MSLRRNQKFYLINTLYWILFGVYRIVPGYLAGMDEFFPWDYVLLICILGVAISSAYREILRWRKHDYTNIRKSILVCSIGCFLSLAIYQVAVIMVDPAIKTELEAIAWKSNGSIIGINLVIVIENVVEVIPWFLLFHFYKYIEAQHLLRNRLLEQEKLVQRLQYENMVAKLNPHFMFNTLNTIRWLVKNNHPSSSGALDKLSNILRYNLTDSTIRRRFNDEISIVNQYLEIEKIRFDERLNYSIAADEHAGNHYIIPFVLLNTVENAIKHGITKITGEGFIDIRITKDKEHILIVVQNTGKLEGVETGFGLKSINALLKNVTPETGSVTIEELEGKVVQVIIKHPQYAS